MRFPAATTSRLRKSSKIRGVAGLRSRGGSRAQRPCQRAIPYQRDHAARRPDRLRQHSRRQLDRQYGLGRRRAAGRIRPANGRPRRHHDPPRHFQQQRSSQPLRRQSRNVHPGDPIRRHVRQHLSDDNSGSRNPRFAQCGLLSRRAILFYRPLSANPGRPRKSAPLVQPDPRLLATGEGLRLYVDVRRPLYAAQLDRGNLDKRVSDSQ